MKSNPAFGRRSALRSALTASMATWFVDPAWAEAEATEKAVDLDVLKAIASNLVGAPVDAFAPAPMPGWYELIVRGEVLYIDASGRHLFQGHLVDVAARTSLTAQRKSAYERSITPVMDVGKLNLGDAIKTVYGRELPGRLLVTFEDPQCGFCKRLHQTLLTMEDLVVHTFPVSFLGPQSRSFNEAIWCSSDRARAWREVMEGIPPAQAAVACDFSALDRNAALADHYRIKGTPTVFNAKGGRIDGASNAQVLSQAVSAGAQP
ncbi:DsbC family protein [Hydrogenophaga sp.]|uniref:DsbC family protein n=1 Tax=Hydrogenophaga sp. TaxID=1904254 RepID=UPI003457BD30